MKKLLTEWRKYLKEEKRVVTAYHGSNVPIQNFSRDHGAQGVMWFSEDKDKIIRGESGALSSKYIMKVELNIENTTGWDDYDEKFLQQIEDEGFDSIQLDDDWIIFDPARVKVVGVEERRKRQTQITLQNLKKQLPTSMEKKLSPTQKRIGTMKKRWSISTN